MIEYKDELHELESKSQFQQGGNIESRTNNSKSKKQMTSFDLQILKLLKKELVERPPILLPREWQDDDYLRILKYCDFDIQTSIDILLEHLDWRKSIETTKIPQQLIEGVIYINGHDKQSHPVMIINVEKAKHVTKQIIKGTLIQFEQTLKFIVTYFLRGSLNKSKITMIIDSRWLQFEKDFLKKPFINFIQQTEKHCYDIFDRIIVLIDKFEDYILPLKASTKEKLTIVNNENLIKIHKFIRPNFLETKYLGQLSDIKNNFWQKQKNNLRPPKINHNESRSLLQFEESNYQQQKQRDCSSSKLMLQVHNEEQEVILSESHLIELPDNFLDDALEQVVYLKLNQISSSPKSNCFQSSQRMQISDTPLQSTTIKQKERPQKFEESFMSSEINSNLILQSLNERECCKESNCQLI